MVCPHGAGVSLTLQLIFDHIVRPAVNLVSEMVTPPHPESAHPAYRCTIPWTGADQSSQMAEAIECSVSLDKMVGVDFYVSETLWPVMFLEQLE